MFSTLGLSKSRFACTYNFVGTKKQFKHFQRRCFFKDRRLNGGIPRIGFLVTPLPPSFLYMYPSPLASLAAALGPLAAPLELI